MPNFVKNKIIVGRSEYGKRLIERYCSYNKNKEIEFDFNKVIKMPEELQIEFSSRSHDGMHLYLTKINPDVSYYGTIEEKIDKASYLKLVEDMKKDILINNDFILSEDTIYRILNKYKEEDNLLELGEKQINNFKKYNAINWYDWSIKNWGTKWNSTNFEIKNDYKSLLFETAWDPSIEIMIEISKQNPNIKFAYLYSDEDIGSNVGYMLMQAGIIDFKGTFENYSIDAYRLAFDIWECEENYKFDKNKNTFVLKDDYST